MTTALHCHVEAGNVLSTLGILPEGYGVGDQCSESKNEAEERSEETQEFASENADEAREMLHLAPEGPATNTTNSTEYPPPEPLEPAPPLLDSEPPPVEPITPPAPPEPSPTLEVAPAPMPEPAAFEPPPAPPTEREPLSVSSVDTPTSVPGPFPRAGEAVAAMAAAAALTGIFYGPGVFYNRLTKKRVETNEVRNRILGLVRLNPGITPAGLARIAGVHLTTVSHHLRILVRFGLAVVYAERGGRRYFENHGRIPLPDRKALALLQRPGYRTFLAAITARENLRLADVAPGFAITVSTAGYRAKQLVSVGLLERDDHRWRLTGQGQRLLEMISAPHPAVSGPSTTEIVNVG